MTEAPPLNPAVQALLEADRVVHEPARLALMLMLGEAEEIEFKFFEHVTGLTRGNLATHLGKLEDVGYIEVRKAFRGRIPVTSYRLTSAGRGALEAHRRMLASLVQSSSPD